MSALLHYVYYTELQKFPAAENLPEFCLFWSETWLFVQTLILYILLDR